MVFWNTVGLFWLVGLQDCFVGYSTVADVERNRSLHVSTVISIDLLCTCCGTVDASVVYPGC